MKTIIKNKYFVTTVLVAVVIILLLVQSNKDSKDIAKEIERSDFSIIKSIEAPNIWPVYLAAKNTCGLNSSDDQCIIECGYGDLSPCYFFNYDRLTQKPHVIATYYSEDDALYQTLMKFKDRNTLQFITRKDFIATSSDSHFIWYTKELNVQSGKITTVKEEETYEPYVSYP
jgi:hypothetical protein